MTVKIGDEVIYHETSGEEHTCKVVAVNGPETVSLEFKSKGRDRRAEHLSHAPGITGECWMTKEEAADQAKAREAELKAKVADKTEDDEEAKDSDGGDDSGDKVAAPEPTSEPQVTAETAKANEDAQNDAPQEDPNVE